MKSTRDRVIELVAEQMEWDPADLKDETLIQLELGMDSLDCVELVMMAEDEFDLIIPDPDIEAIQTISEAVAYIERRLA